MQTLTGLNTPILDLSGKPLMEAVTMGGEAIRDENGRTILEPATVKRCLANILALGRSEEPARAISLAVRIMAVVDTLDVEDADLAVLRAAVIENRTYNNLVITRVQEALQPPPAPSPDGVPEEESVAP